MKDFITATYIIIGDCSSVFHPYAHSLLWNIITYGVMICQTFPGITVNVFPILPNFLLQLKPAFPCCYQVSSQPPHIEINCPPVDMQKKLPELATLNFIEKGKSIIMTSNPGTGKTMVSIALGYTSFEREGMDLLFNNLSLRAARKSTIITSNLSFEHWVEVFGDPTVASAMIDRLTYKAVLVDMEGDSYRLRETLKENGASFNFESIVV